MVSGLDFYSDDPSLNPDEAHNRFCKILFEKNVIVAFVKKSTKAQIIVKSLWESFNLIAQTTNLYF